MTHVKGKVTFQNVFVGALTALVIFLGSWVLEVNTNIALIKQDVANKELTRQAEYSLLKSALSENKQNYQKMAETMSNLDRTLALLVDRLERGDITVNQPVK
ncbi:hypothetical protein JCM19235_1223 [Vibrio maritimus]|uniref:Uncharacterized protein n=1 Tax=Vibrio maritimus TaxID=990268 RepID=A0A090SUB7_9VIBR|nr:hypothetical protein JCM19235_1223 [Vibrio maritimus]